MVLKIALLVAVLVLIRAYNYEKKRIDKKKK